mgnify:CR=1 FL=1
MNLEFLRALESQRPGIRANWENLLRLERMSTPLANPDTLVHLLDVTLNEIFLDLRLWSPRRRPSHVPAPACPCGRNPLLAYFAAGRQALHQALVVAQASTPEVAPAERNETMACLDQVFGRIARREIESFCAICQFRPSPVTHAHDPIAHRSNPGERS